MFGLKVPCFKKLRKGNKRSEKKKRKVKRRNERVKEKKVRRRRRSAKEKAMEEMNIIRLMKRAVYLDVHDHIHDQNVQE